MCVARHPAGAFRPLLVMGGVMVSLLAKVGFESIVDGRIVYGVFALFTFLIAAMGFTAFHLCLHIQDKEALEKLAEGRAPSLDAPPGISEEEKEIKAQR